MPNSCLRGGGYHIEALHIHADFAFLHKPQNAPVLAVPLETIVRRSIEEPMPPRKQAMTQGK